MKVTEILLCHTNEYQIHTSYHLVGGVEAHHPNLSLFRNGSQLFEKSLE